MASSGGRYVFQTRIGKGGIIVTSKFFGGFSFETLHFLENRRPPWDVINDRSLSIASKTYQKL